MKRPDLDNLRKAASDACQGILFVNDSQVAWGKMRKVFIDKFTEAEPYTVIRFTPVLPVVLDLDETPSQKLRHKVNTETPRLRS